MFRDVGMRAAKEGLAELCPRRRQFAATRGALKSLAEILAPQLDGRLAPWNARMFLFALLPGLDRQQPAPYASRSVGRSTRNVNTDSTH